ncbi:uncharacterized protein [Anabrus simplex]|uniref:uncharacterized protein n=1 Tax=Anabrus simplex TaxID=316456 RepID=UPI0035A3C685
MAAESDGIQDMVSGEEEPIDLSKTPRKSLRLMPPLIPIRLLRPGYNQRQAVRPDDYNRGERALRPIPRLNAVVPHYPSQQTVVPIQQNNIRDWRERSAVGEEDEDEEEEETNDEVSRKRVRLEQEVGCDSWLSQRLDRARSVPQLAPLPIPLQRHKSLSESRISVATAAGSATEDSSDWHEEELRQRLQMATALQAPGEPGSDNEALLKSSWIYVGYYSQLLHRFQAQEMLRQIALQRHRDSPEDQNIEGTSLPAPKSEVPSDDVGDIKRRQARPLTGKHVRPGTGASPATLLTLRRKIQARQQQHNPKGLHE